MTTDAEPDVDTDIAIRLLGPLLVTVAGRPVEVTSGKQRALLAALASRPGKDVSADELARWVWTEHQPEHIRASLHTLVARLRRLLGEAAIATTTCGYRLDVREESVDASRFSRLLAAEEHAADDASRHELLSSALSLWVGEPEFADRMPQLVERHLVAVQRQADIDIAGGRADGLIAELTDLTRRHPLREALRERLIRALAATGRTSEALASYAAYREHLADELGVDPGNELQRLHLELLAGDGPVSSESSSAASSSSNSHAPRAPRELPRDIGYFTGRSDELGDLLAAAATDADSVVITAIDGMAGIGKTTLAVRAAHRLAADYPDGQLWLNLHGHTPGQRPLRQEVALDRLLRAVGVDRVPDEPAERAALWRTRMADRRALIVLDDAADAAQVRPLLPGAAGCLVLVTSRRRLTGIDGAHVLSLDLLSRRHAVELFTRVVNDDRPAGEPEATERVVNLCGRLPLAIRIAASRLRHRPQWTVERLLARLRSAADRLDELGDDDTGVAAALDMSYGYLADEQRRLFRLLGLHPGAEFDAHAAAALAGESARATERRLQHLVDVNLLTEPTAGRYRMHDLVRAWAGRLAEDEGGDARLAALTRLFDYYVHVAALACAVAYPADRQRRPDATPTSLGDRTDLPGLPDRRAAIGWLAAERVNLITCAGYAEKHGWPRHTVRIACAMWRFLERGGHSDDARALHGRALVLARQQSDRYSEMWLSIASAARGWRGGRPADARDYGESAAAIARALGDRHAEAHAVGLAAVGYQGTGELDKAVEYYRRSIAIAHDAGNVLIECNSWLNMAETLWRKGNREKTFDAVRQAHSAALASGDDFSQAMTLSNMGRMFAERGQHVRAIEALTRAIAAFDDLGGVPRAKANALWCLAQAIVGAGDHASAQQHLRQALAIASDIGDVEHQQEALRDLAQLARTAGDDGSVALDWSTKALTVAERLGDPFRLADAYDGLGDSYAYAGDSTAAAEHWRAALRLFDELSAPNSADVRAKLDELDHVRSA